MYKPGVPRIFDEIQEGYFVEGISTGLISDSINSYLFKYFISVACSIDSCLLAKVMEFGQLVF